MLSNNVDAVRHGRRSNMIYCTRAWQNQVAGIAQLGERKTEDLEAPCSIHGPSIIHVYQCFILPFAHCVKYLPILYVRTYVVITSIIIYLTFGGKFDPPVE